MKLLLTSAGITNNAIATALTDLAGKPFSELSIILIPTAGLFGHGDKSWLIDDMVRYQKYGFKSIDILDISATHEETWKSRLEEADIISFGGGNEYYLAEIFEEVGMKKFLQSLPETKIYMGTSAGSMVAGQFLQHTIHRNLYPEEDFGLTETDPMQLYDFLFVPHLNSEWFTHVRKENLVKLRDQFEYPVYAMDDYTALSIVDGNVEIIGSGDYWLSNE